MNDTIIVGGMEYKKTPARRLRITESMVKATALVEKEERRPAHLIDHNYLAQMRSCVTKLEELLRAFDA